MQVGVSSDEIGLTVERAMPAGRILCELVTNVIKYAFPGDGTLEVVSDAGVHVRIVFPVDAPEG